MTEYVDDVYANVQLRLDDGSFTPTTFEGNLDNFETSPATPGLPRPPAIRLNDGSWLFNASAYPSHQLLCRHTDGRWFQREYYGSKTEISYGIGSYACANDATIDDLAGIDPIMYDLMLGYSASLTTGWGMPNEYFETGLVAINPGLATYGKPLTIQFTFTKQVFDTHPGYTYAATSAVSGSRYCGIQILGRSTTFVTLDDYVGAQVYIYKKSGGPTYPVNTTGRTMSNSWYPGVMSVGGITVASVSQADSHLNGYTLIHSSTVPPENINMIGGAAYVNSEYLLSDANGELSDGIDKYAIFGAIYLPVIDRTIRTTTSATPSSTLYNIVPREVFPV